MSGTYKQWQLMYKIALENGIKTMGEMERYFKKFPMTKFQNKTVKVSYGNEQRTN